MSWISRVMRQIGSPITKAALNLSDGIARTLGKIAPKRFDNLFQQLVDEDGFKISTMQKWTKDEIKLFPKDIQLSEQATEVAQNVQRMTETFIGYQKRLNITGDVAKNLLEARKIKSYMGSVYDLRRYLDIQIEKLEYALKKGGESYNANKINALNTLRGSRNHVNNVLVKRIVRFEWHKMYKPRYAAKLCLEHPRACARTGLVALGVVASAAPIAIAATNLKKCGRFDARANACDLPASSASNEVETALNQFNEGQRSCFVTCMPTNYSTTTAYPTSPAYNTLELAQQAAASNLGSSATNGDLSNINDSDVGPLSMQKFCSATEDAAQGCESYCLAECKNYNPNLDPVIDDVNKEDEIVGWIVVAISIVVAIIVVALGIYYFRKRSSLPKEEDELLQELERDQ